MGQALSDEEDIRSVHRVLSGDTSAYRVIVEKYADRMLAFCRSRAATEEDAADAAQETFVRAFRSLRSFRLGSSFASWLFAIAANRSRTGWARKASEQGRIERLRAEAAATDPEDPETAALRRLEAEEIRSAIASLPAELRTSVEAYYLAELSVSEVAELLGVGDEAVKSRLFRARKKLREALEARNRNDPEGVS